MKIAYLTTCFGTQSHTFIRREIRALRAKGITVKLYGVHKDPGQHADDAADLVAQTHYLYPIRPLQLLLSILSAFLCSPIRFVSGMGKAFSSEEFSLKRRLKMLYHYIAATTLVKPLKAAEITHIHAHFMNVSASVAMYAAYHAKIPFSITVHSAGTYKTPHILGVKQKLESAQFLMMISHYNIQYFNAITPCKHKAHVVRCGMDLSEFSFSAPETPQNHSPIQLLAVGRFVEKKGFRYLIEAANILRKNNVNFHLQMIGDGPLLNELQALSTQHKLDSHITFLGKKNTADVHKSMLASDIVVVPSVTSQSGEMEGLPVVIMEAMALGVPVVSTEHSGIPEIVKAGETGALTPEKSPTDLAHAITELANRTSNSILINAHQLVEKEFNIERVAEQRQELFTRYHTAPNSNTSTQSKAEQQS